MPPGSIAERPPHPASTRRVAIRLFLCFQLFYAITASGRLHTVDEYETFYMTESLVERGELALPPSKGFFGRRGKDGRFWAPYGPLPAIVAAPGYLAGKAVAGGLATSEKQRESLLWFFTSLTNSTLAALGVLLFFLVATRLGARPVHALCAATALGVATPHWHYATTFFSEPLSAALFLGSALALAAWKANGAAPSPLALAFAGLPLALLVATRMTNAVLFPVLGAAVLALCAGSARRKLLTAIAYSLPAAGAVALYLAWNWVRFGDPLQPGYPESIRGARAVDFGESLPRGVLGLTFSPGKGVFVFAPPAMLGIVLARPFLRATGRFGWLLLALPCVAILFYAKYSYWEGGYCWGPRFLVPSLAFWVLPLAFLPWGSRPAQRLIVPLIVVATAFQLLGVSVSFLECQVNRGYYDADFRYNLGYSAPSETVDVIAHHVSESLEGRFLSEPEGLGFDRWFFFLRKAGFSAGGLSCAVVVLGACLGASLLLLAQALRRLRDEEREGEGTAESTPSKEETSRPIASPV